MTHGSVAVIIQARMTSSRLPGKVMMPLAGMRVIDHVIARAKAVPGVDQVCIAIPDNRDQQELQVHLERRGDVQIHSGPEDDVLARYAGAAKQVDADVLIRVTSDCPCLDPLIVGGMLALKMNTGAAYVRNAFESGLPSGYDAEILDRTVLSTAAAEATDPYEREHVTPFLWRRPGRFPTFLVDFRPDCRLWRIVLDTPSDYELVKLLYARLYEQDPLFGWEAVRTCIEREPGLLDINRTDNQKPYAGSPDKAG